MTHYLRRYRITPRFLVSSGSGIIDSILALVFRKDCPNPYGTTVVDGLIELGLLKKVVSQKGTFYFKTEKSESFTTNDLVVEYLWSYWNKDKREIRDNKRFIYCYSSKIETGRGLVEINEALEKGIV